MKLLPSPTFARRIVRTPSLDNSGVGQGLDGVLTLAVFLGLGYLLDRWLGTQPVFMIALLLLSAAGVFLGWKARYNARMEQLEAERRLRASGAAVTDHSEVVR